MGDSFHKTRVVPAKAGTQRRPSKDTSMRALVKPPWNRDFYCMDKRASSSLRCMHQMLKVGGSKQPGPWRRRRVPAPAKRSLNHLLKALSG
jgi:hypothetical protein